MNPEDHDLLIEIKQDIKYMREKLEDHLRAYSEHLKEDDMRFKDLDGRVGKLEEFRWWFLGVAAAVGVIGSFVIDTVRDWLLKR